MLCPEIVLRLVLGVVSWLVSLEQRKAYAGKRLLDEWFIMALCVVFGSEQSPRQASLAKNEIAFDIRQVRSKNTWKMNLIEGVLPSNSRVVLIEDAVSTGRSALSALKAKRSSKSNALGVIAIFTFELPISERIFRENKIPFFALCNYSCVIETALRSNYMNNAQLEKLKKWKKTHAR